MGARWKIGYSTRDVELGYSEILHEALDHWAGNSSVKNDRNIQDDVACSGLYSHFTCQGITNKR